MPTDFSTTNITPIYRRLVAGAVPAGETRRHDLATELHLALSSIPDLFSANGAFSCEPGASPQELKLRVNKR
jgi:hypothetical protein